MKNLLVLVIIILLIGNSIPTIGIEVENSSTLSFNGKTLYVGGYGPGNYTSIQAAINDANTGDTVFVFAYSSPYFENIVVDKSINLIGEEKENTVIDGNNKGNVVEIFSDFVNISGFRIINSGTNRTDASIYIISDFNKVIDNILEKNDDGILIQNGSNNHITSNNLSNNDYGIWLINKSSNNTIIGNIFSSNNWWGIRLEDSEHNIFSDNEINNNGNGIYLEESDCNNFSKNIIKNNWYGMELTSSNKIKILSNSFLNDDLFVYDSYKNTIFNNTVDEKPLIYLEEESDIKIDDFAGQIILVNCENISIINQNISGIVHGIELWNCNSCDISKITLTNNHFALTLYYCGNNLISENNISNNNYGIVFDSSNDINTAINNDITENEYGISIFGVNYTTFITDNKFSKNGFGVQAYKSNNSIISNNTFSNEFVGVYILFISSNNAIFSNVFINCGDGIWLHLANDNTVYKNIIMVSEYDGIGIWLLQSYYNKVLNNTITDCFISIQLFYSYYNIVSDNHCFKGGIGISYSFQNTIISNYVNIKPIVYLEDKSDKNVEEAGQVILVNCKNIKVQNLNLSNAFFGVVLWDSNACYISNNTLSYNYHGIYMTDSHNNSISGNKISNYIYFGTNCYSSNDNNFSNNDVSIENKIFKRLNFYHKTPIVLKTTLKNYNLSKLHSYFDSLSTDVINDFCLFGINPFLYKKDVSTNESNGMSFYSCNKNIISENNFRNNIEGIIFKESNRNLIRQNNIENNDRGIFFDNSLQNKIMQNNFIKNKKHAFFINCKNTWKENYWNRLRFFPKLIFGEIEILEKTITWINIDWRPAKKPYDI